MNISILGIRGIPAAHGGFETFAEVFSLYLKKRGWNVTVYCQTNKNEVNEISEDEWQGIRRININILEKGALGTILFDWKSVRHASKSKGVILTLGYNTAIFSLWYKYKGVSNVINMDGLEWKRDKWKWYEKFWLWINERAGCLLGDHLIADHPEIKNHLKTRVCENKITIIPYGANEIADSEKYILKNFNLENDRYAILIARPEPENSIYEIVESFSRKKRNMKLVVLGNYNKEINLFHKKVISKASDEVMFLGAIYDKKIVECLRFFSEVYIHGHRVGGTNPSLVEALGAGSAIISHDNKFNKWVAGEASVYFSDADECAEIFDKLSEKKLELNFLREKSKERFENEFQWDRILMKYEQVLSKFMRSN